MRKAGERLDFFRMGAFTVLLVCLGASDGWGQTAAPAAGGQASPVTEEMPKDPGALMLLAAKSNGLTGDDVQPWRLKASYTVLDEQGKTKEEGTVEELWVGPKKSRITFTFGGMTQTTYYTEAGAYRTGTDIKSGVPEEVRYAFVEPLPSVEVVQQDSYQLKELDTGGTKLECASSVPAASRRIWNPGMTFCFNTDKPMLRVVIQSAGAGQCVRNKMALFQGRYLAKDLHMTHQGKMGWTAKLESVERMRALDAADFTPPPDAKLLPKRVMISSGVAQGLLASQVPPHYPVEAKQRQVSGTVVLQVSIGKDGSVQDLKVISGPPLLQDEALEAVRQWKYKPYLLNGEAVEVMTTVNIVFNLG